MKKTKERQTTLDEFIKKERQTKLGEFINED